MDPSGSIQALLNALQDVSRSPKDAERFELISKAKELIFTLQSPEEHVMQLSANDMELVAIRTMTRMGVLEVLPMQEHTAMELETLAEKTGLHAVLLERFLRLLVATRFIQQDSQGRYFHTHISKGYMKGGKAGAWLKGVLELMITPTTLGSIFEDFFASNPFIEPADITHTPCHLFAGSDGENLWTAWPRNEPQKMKNFQRAMALLSDVAPVTGAYDFSQLVAGEEDSSRTILVDVGGGAGHCVEMILKAHPEIPPSRCVVQDLADTLALARSLDSTLPTEVQLQEHDFFNPQPILHAKAYFMRWIIHDYVDARAVEILKPIADAMAEDSVLLICEAVLPERLDESALMAVVMDVLVMACSGKERTRKGFERLFAEAGLTVRRYWEREGTVATVIECVKQC